MSDFLGVTQLRRYRARVQICPNWLQGWGVLATGLLPLRRSPFTEHRGGLLGL